MRSLHGWASVRAAYRACLEDQKGAVDVVLPHRLDKQSAVLLSIDPANDTHLNLRRHPPENEAIGTPERPEQGREGLAQSTSLRRVI